jgi:hypothetical protein
MNSGLTTTSRRDRLPAPVSPPRAGRTTCSVVPGRTVLWRALVVSYGRPAPDLTAPEVDLSPRDAGTRARGPGPC